MEYPALNRGLFALLGDIPLLHFPLTPYSYFLYVFSFLASLSRNPCARSRDFGLGKREGSKRAGRRRGKGELGKSRKIAKKYAKIMQKGRPIMYNGVVSKQHPKS